MKRSIIATFFLLICFSATLISQVPVATQVKIVKAEDERRYDSVIEGLMTNKDAKIRARAALAAGRIGDEKAVPALADLLANDPSTDVRALAAFALGETESMLASESILKAMLNEAMPGAIRARAVEAAGKIVAANAAKGKSKMIDNLGDGILDILKQQDKLGAKQDRGLVLLALTAALRAHARAGIKGLTKEEIEAVDTGGAVAPFLKNADARIRTDAGNTLSRARYKKANEELRKVLTSDPDGEARANAARALGPADDKGAVDILLNAAITDKDSRVRVSAIRSLGTLREARVAEKLIERGESLLGVHETKKLKSFTNKNELLEIATVVGRLLQGTANARAIGFLNQLRASDKYSSGETEIALARVSPEVYMASVTQNAAELFADDWRTSAAVFQALAEIANLEKSPVNDNLKSRVRLILVRAMGAWFNAPQSEKNKGMQALAVPDMIRAFAAYKSDNTSGIIRPLLEIEPDILIRAAAAEILGDQPASKENTEALKKAFTSALLTDTFYNDAQLGILDALYKADKKEGVGTFLIALSARDHLVRQRAMTILEDKDLQKDFPGIPTSLEKAKADGKDRPQQYLNFGTKLGQVLNTDADYRRAVSRKNGSVRALLATTKGTFILEFLPEDAPLTVDNFVKLARAGYFNGLMVHRVVPNFVMQDGDPRGDGNGGPGWSIRCELNMVEYDRGAVGMALSGKDTGGSQWFVTHSPQPHLDGGYTVFGRVDDAGMRVVDAVTRGDKIISVKIVESGSPQKGAKGRNK